MKYRKKAKKSKKPTIDLNEEKIFKISSVKNEDGSGFIIITVVDEDDIEESNEIVSNRHKSYNNSNSQVRASRKPKRPRCYRRKSRRSR